MIIVADRCPTPDGTREMHGPRRSFASSLATRRPTACSPTITRRREATGAPTSISCRPSPSLEPGWNRSESHEIKLNPAYGDINRSEFSPVGVSVFLSACHRFGEPYLTPPRLRSRSIAAATPSVSAVDRGAGDQHASACLDDQRCGLVIDPAVDLQLAAGAE